MPVGDALMAFHAAGDHASRRILQVHGQAVAGVDAAPDGSRLVVTSCDELCGEAVFDTHTGHRVTGLGDSLGVDRAPDSRRVVAGRIGGSIMVVDTVTLTETEIYRLQPFAAGAPLFTADGESVIVTDLRDDQPVFRITSAGGCCAAEDLAAGGRGYGRDVSPDGQYLAFTDYTSEFTLAVSRLGEGPIPLPGGGGVGGEFAPTVNGTSEPAPQDPAGVLRLEGPSRVQTAVAASQDLWADDGAFSAVVVRADDFAPLAASPLAVNAIGSLLLSGRDGLHPDTAAELQRILPPGNTVYVVGGTAVLSDQIEDDIRALGLSPVRLGGSNRFETAQLVADQASDFIAGDAPLTVWAVQGGSFPDGIIGGNAAARTAGVVLLGVDGVVFARESYPDAEVIQLGDWDAGVVDRDHGS